MFFLKAGFAATRKLTSGGCGVISDLLYLSEMAKKKQTTKRSRSIAATAQARERIFETDSTYFLKLVVFVLLGTLWLKFQAPATWVGVPLTGIPVGLLAGLLLVRKFEHHQSDRKIWYAILLVVTIICYFVPAGVVI